MNSRSAVFLVALAFLAAACVSVTPGDSPAPTASPTLGITTMAPTTPPPPTTTPLPTDEPTAEPTAESTARPQGSPESDIDVLFSDDFSDLGGVCSAGQAGTADCWGVGANVAGTIAYSGGTLTFDIPLAESWMWSRRTVDQTWPVMAVEGVAVPTTDGIFGAMCGASGDEFVGGVVSTNGAWIFARLDSSGVTVLSSDATAGLSVPVGLATSFGIGCQTTDTGEFELFLALDGATVATYEGDDGPTGFDRVGMYAEALVPDYSVSIDNVIAYGGR